MNRSANDMPPEVDENTIRIGGDIIDPTSAPVVAAATMLGLSESVLNRMKELDPDVAAADDNIYDAVFAVASRFSLAVRHRFGHGNIENATRTMVRFLSKTLRMYPPGIVRKGMYGDVHHVYLDAGWIRMSIVTYAKRQR